MIKWLERMFVAIALAEGGLFKEAVKVLREREHIRPSNRPTPRLTPRLRLRA